MKKILVVGSSGFLGSKIFELASIRYLAHGTFYSNATPSRTWTRLDIVDRTNVQELMTNLAPNVVINAAGLTNVENCESHPGKALAANATGTRNLAEACAGIGAKLVHISTNYVFDGEREAYTETDKPNPLNVYGRTKLQGERYVMNACKDHAIIRTSLLYRLPDVNHTESEDFVAWLLKKLRRLEIVQIAEDLRSCPTNVDTLAEAVLKIAVSDFVGLLHVAGRDCLSRYEFARAIADVFGVDPNLIKASESSVLWPNVQKPKHTCLNSRKVENELGIVSPGVKAVLSETRRDHDSFQRE